MFYSKCAFTISFTKKIFKITTCNSKDVTFKRIGVVGRPSAIHVIGRYFRFRLTPLNAIEAGRSYKLVWRIDLYIGYIHFIRLIRETIYISFLPYYKDHKMGDIKSFFHQWCAKTTKEPQFDVRPTGTIFYTL